MSAYWLNHGIPDGKVEVQFKQVSVKAELLEETEGFDAKILLEDMHTYNPYLLDNLLDDVSTEIEMKVNRQMELYEEEKNKILIEKYDTAFAEELHAFDAPLDVIPIVDYVYESDINNDGINEQYVKRQTRLLLYTDQLFDLSIGGEPALTDTGYYGKHEGRNGLTYYMESAGKETDFKRLFGLDIWEGELTPLWFCVRNTEKGNVVYFIYQDENEYEKRIDGYFADGKQYEKKVSIRCIPEMQCTLQYEMNGTEKNSSLDYFTCLTEDSRSVEFVFGSYHPLEATINQNVQTRIAEKISEAEKEGMRYVTLNRYTLAATEEKYVMEYMIVSERLLETDTEGYDRRRYCMEVDLNTGVCTDIDGKNEEMKNGFDEIERGNFSVITGLNEDDLKELETVYNNLKETGGTEWLLFDLNNDGEKELIWREKAYPSEYMKNIIAVFANTKEGYQRILWDIFDMTEFFILENNNLIYYSQGFSTYDYGAFTKYTMNHNFLLKEEEKLEIFIILDSDEMNTLPGRVREELPNVTEEGCYFKVTTYSGNSKSEDILSRDVWLHKFEIMLGVPLSIADPYWYELINE